MHLQALLKQQRLARLATNQEHFDHMIEVQKLGIPQDEIARRLGVTNGSGFAKSGMTHILNVAPIYKMAMEVPRWEAVSPDAVRSIPVFHDDFPGFT